MQRLFSFTSYVLEKWSPCVIVEVEILHANNVLGLYGSSDSKTQVLIVQELFHDPVESSE